MRVVFIVLAIFFGLGLVGGAGALAKGQTSPGVVVFCALLTFLFGFLAWRSKGKTAFKPLPQAHNSQPAPGALPGLGQSMAQQFFQQPDISIQQLRGLAAQKGWDAVELKRQAENCLFPIAQAALEDGILSEEEEAEISRFCNEFDIAPADMPLATQALLVKGAILRDLLNGEYKQRVQMPDLPFNLMKSEKALWLFNNVGMAELKTKTTYVGGSQGASIRVAKGLYWRVGGFKGRQVQEQELERKSNAAVLITTKHLYYLAGHEVKRIRHEKIIGINPSSNGIAVYQEAASAKPLFFSPDDPWFFMNLMQNAGNLND